MLRAVLFAALGGGAACGAGAEPGIALTLRLDGAIGEADLARVTRLVFQASGDEGGRFTADLGRALAREERVRYRPAPGTHALSIEVTAVTESGAAVAAGRTAPLSVRPDASVEADVLLVAEAADGGADLGGADLAHVCPPTAFCDDFEQGLTSWKDNPTNGIVTLDTTRFYAGATSAHLHTNPLSPNGQTAASAITATAPFANGPRADLWLRAYLYAGNTPTTYWPVLTVRQASPATGRVSLEVLPSDGTFYLHDDLTAPHAQGSPTTLPVGRWFCLELAIKVDVAGYVTLFVDGAQVASSDADTRGTLDALTFGGGLASGSTAEAAHDLWVDSVIVDSVRAGCAF